MIIFAIFDMVWICASKILFINIGFLLNDFLKDYPSGILIIDSDNRIAAVNKPFQDFLSVTESDLNGKHLLDVVKLPELFALVAKAAENAGSSITGKIKGKEIRIRSIVNDKKEIAGEILLL